MAIITCNHLQSPAITYNHLQSPAITCNHLQSPAITCNQLQSPAIITRAPSSPAITCNHYNHCNHCNHEWPSSPAIASSMSSTRWSPARLPAATSAEHVASLAPTGVPMTAERTLRPPPSADSAELRRTATGGHRRPSVSKQACNQGSPQ